MPNSETESVQTEENKPAEDKNNELLANIAQQLQVNNQRLENIEKSRQEKEEAQSYRKKKYEEEEELDEDALLERKVNNVIEMRKRQEYEKRRKERNKNPIPFLRQELDDFDSVYTKENLEMIDKKFPAISYTLQKKLNAGENEDAVRLAYSVLMDEKRRKEEVVDNTPQAKMYNQKINPRLAGSMSASQGGRTNSVPDANRKFDNVNYANPFAFDDSMSVLLDGNAFRSKDGIPYCKSERCKKAHSYVNSLKNQY